jgi:membrane-associated phospholipid phosphatase
VSALPLDHRLLMLARTRGHGPRRDRVVSTFSRTGEHAASWLALGASGAVLAGPGERRGAWLRGVCAVAASYGINTTLKLVVGRSRPQLPGLPPLTPTVSALSFPSAHATTSFVAARVYGGLLPGAALYAIATAYALSRPYLGVHYPSDVVAGALLGTLIAVAWPKGGARCR